jgi:hypothetical protein
VTPHSAPRPTVSFCACPKPLSPPAAADSLDATARSHRPVPARLTRRGPGLPPPVTPWGAATGPPYSALPRTASTRRPLRHNHRPAPGHLPPSPLEVPLRPAQRRLPWLNVAPAGSVRCLAPKGRLHSPPPPSVDLKSPPSVAPRQPSLSDLAVHLADVKVIFFVFCFKFWIKFN